MESGRHMAKQIAVVLAQGQSHNPAKRGLEEAIVTELLMTAGVDTIVVPHPYDLHADHPALLGLKGLAGDFILLSWLYPRAAHWTLDQHGIRGRMGETQLKSLWDERKKKWEKKVQDTVRRMIRPAWPNCDRPCSARSIIWICG